MEISKETLEVIAGMLAVVVATGVFLSVRNSKKTKYSGNLVFNNSNNNTVTNNKLGDENSNNVEPDISTRRTK